MQLKNLKQILGYNFEIELTNGLHLFLIINLGFIIFEDMYGYGFQNFESSRQSALKKKWKRTISKGNYCLTYEIVEVFFFILAKEDIEFIKLQKTRMNPSMM